MQKLSIFGSIRELVYDRVTGLTESNEDLKVFDGNNAKEIQEFPFNQWNLLNQVLSMSFLNHVNVLSKTIRVALNDLQQLRKRIL